MFRSDKKKKKLFEKKMLKGQFHMTQVNGSLLGLTSSSRKCGLGIWNPETLRAGCDLTQPWAACHRDSFSCSLCRDNLQHLSTLKHVDAPQAIIQQYGLGEHCRFGFTANVVWSQSYFNDSTVYSLCPFETLAYYICYINFLHLFLLSLWTLAELRCFQHVRV